MPWTFSHPAVVFPIKQSKYGAFLSLPALILGSLSPDLFYSVAWYDAASTAHEWLGWLYTGLPLCLLIFFITQKTAFFLQYALPFSIKSKFSYSFRHITVLLASFYIGAATHIVWDSFTHESGAMVRQLDFLQLGVFNMTDTQEIAIYKLLQHLGSLLGLLYLLFKYWQYHRNQLIIIQKQNLLKLKALLVIAIISVVCALPLAYRFATNFNRFVYLELTLMVPFFFGAVLLFALVKYKRRERKDLG